MPKPRGRKHTTLTETAALVVKELKKLPAIKMIAPGEIKTTRRNKSGKRHLTMVITTAGFELIVTGQSTQKIAVHTTAVKETYKALKNTKSLRDFVFSYRERKPDI